MKPLLIQIDMVMSDAETGEGAVDWEREGQEAREYSMSRHKAQS